MIVRIITQQEAEDLVEHLEERKDIWLPINTYEIGRHTFLRLVDSLPQAAVAVSNGLPDNMYGVAARAVTNAEWTELRVEHYIDWLLDKYTTKPDRIQLEGILRDRLQAEGVTIQDASITSIARDTIQSFHYTPPTPKKPSEADAGGTTSDTANNLGVDGVQAKVETVPEPPKEAPPAYPPRSEQSLYLQRLLGKRVKKI